MAEEVQNTQAQEQTDAAQCKALYDLVVKKDLTDDEKNQIKTIIETSPQILTQKEFTQNFKMTDFAFDCAKPEDLPLLIEQNKQNIEALNQALSNLTEVHVTHNGKNKTAAQFLLDTPVLENGELIGTQLAKNIHFLGTATRDPSVPDNFKTELLGDAFLQNEAFYKSLYAEEGYGANPNARNVSGQKVQKLMLECILIRNKDQKTDEERQRVAEAKKQAKDMHIFLEDVNVQNSSIETLKNQTFMQHPDMSAMRQTLTVEKPRDTVSYETLAEKAYRGTLTVGEKEQFEKMKKQKQEDSMEYKPSLNPHKDPKKEHKDKFKEQDVIDYMYNEWFLAGLSWLFDKAEDGLDYVLDKLIDNQHERSARRARESHLTKDATAAELMKRVHAFEDITDKCMDDAAKERNARNNTFVTDKILPLLDVDFTKLDQNPTQKAELEAKYTPSLIAKFMAKAAEPDGAKQITDFLKRCPQRFENSFKTNDNIERLAMLQVKHEMINDVMCSTGAWRQRFKKDFKTDEQMREDYNARVAKRKSELAESVSALQADAKLMAEVEWSAIDPADKAKQKEFIDEHILKELNTQIAESSDAKQKEAALAQKELFEATYAKLPAEMRTEFVLHTIAEIKTAEFLREQMEITHEAKKIQEQDRTEGRYDVNDYYPHKETSECFNKAAGRRESVAKNGINDRILKAEVKKDVKAQKDLYEATFQTDTEKMLEAAQKVETNAMAKLEARRLNLDHRKERLIDFKKTLQLKKVMSGLSPVLMGQQVKSNG